MRKLTFPTILVMAVIGSYKAYACPKGTVKVMVYNTSPTFLKLETKDEHTCRRQHVALVKPGIKGKYCIDHDYVLKVTTLSRQGDTRLAITATDLWNDLIITTPKDNHPDIVVKRLRGDVKIVGKPRTVVKEEIPLGDNEPLMKTWRLPNKQTPNPKSKKDGHTHSQQSTKSTAIQHTTPTKARLKLKQELPLEDTQSLEEGEPFMKRWYDEDKA